MLGCLIVCLFLHFGGREEREGREGRGGEGVYNNISLRITVMSFSKKPPKKPRNKYFPTGGGGAGSLHRQLRQDAGVPSKREALQSTDVSVH